MRKGGAFPLPRRVDRVLRWDHQYLVPCKSGLITIRMIPCARRVVGWIHWLNLLSIRAVAAAASWLAVPLLDYFGPWPVYLLGGELLAFVFVRNAAPVPRNTCNNRQAVMPSLAIFRSHAAVTVILVLLYSIAVTLPHQPVQDWLVNNLLSPLGSQTFYTLMAALGFIALTTAALLVTRRMPNHTARVAVRNFSILTLVLVLIAWRWLSVNNSELVHFPQYAITGFTLMALTLSVTESLSWVILLGGIDEAHQYAVLHPTWGIPYDFNDVTLDFLGGTIGVLLCLLWLRAVPRPPKSWRVGPGTTLLGLTVAAGALLLLTNHALLYQDVQRSDYLFAMSRMPPKGFWFFDATWGPRSIHPLTPIEGPILLLGLLYIYSRLDRRYQFSL